MERNEISEHEVKVYLVLLNRPKVWLSAKDVIGVIKDVAPRTVRAHLHKFVELGLLDQAEIFPGHRYRWSGKADQRNRSYLHRLKGAAEILGLS